MADPVYDPNNPLSAYGVEPLAPAAPTAGLRRQQPIYTGEAVDNRSWLEKSASSAGVGFQAGLRATEGLLRRAAGDVEGSDKALVRSLELEDEARRLGPQVQTFEDASKAGGGFDDYVAATGHQLVGLVPDMALALTGAGVATSVARRTSTGAARALARRKAVEIAEQRGLKFADDAAGRGARANVIDDIAAQLPVAPSERAMRTAGALGAAAGELPGLTRGSTEALQATDQAGALKILGANSIAALVGGLPEARIINRVGGSAAVKQVEDQAQKYLARIAKETGKQGALEGTAEAAQQAVQLAGHKWAGQNIDLLGEDAFEQYVASFFGGAILGGLLGGGVETGRVGGELIGKGVDATKRGVSTAIDKTKGVGRELYQRVRENVRLAADRVKAARGEPMDTPSVKAGAPVGEPTPTALSEAFAKARDTVKGFGEKASELTAKFKQRVADIRESDDIDDIAGSEFDGLTRQLASDPDNAWTDQNSESIVRARKLGIPAESLSQRIAIKMIPSQHEMWTEYDPKGLTRMLRSVSKMLDGKELNADDKLRLDTLRATFPKRMALLETIQPQFARQESALSEIDDPDDGPQTAMSLAFQEAEAQRPPVDTLDAEPDETDGSGDAPAERLLDNPSEIADTDLKPLDRYLAASRRAKELTAQIEATPEGPARAQLEAQRQEQRNIVGPAKEAARAELFGAPRKSQPLGRNVFVVSSLRPEAAAKQKAVIRNNPDYVGILNDKVPLISSKNGSPVFKDGEPVTVDYGLDVSSMLMQQQARGQDVSKQDALLRAYGDIAALGLQIDPDTIRPGTLYKKMRDPKNPKRWINDTKRPLITITPGMARELRGAVKRQMDDANRQFPTELTNPAQDSKLPGDAAHVERFVRNKIDVSGYREEENRGGGQDETQDPFEPSPDLLRQAPRAQPVGTSAKNVTSQRSVQYGASLVPGRDVNKQQSIEIAPRQRFEGDNVAGGEAVDTEGFVPTQSPVTEVNFKDDGTVSVRNAPDNTDTPIDTRNDPDTSENIKKMFGAARKLVGGDAKIGLNDVARAIERISDAPSRQETELLLRAERYVDGLRSNQTDVDLESVNPIYAALERRQFDLLPATREAVREASLLVKQTAAAFDFDAINAAPSVAEKGRTFSKMGPKWAAHAGRAVVHIRETLGIDLFDIIDGLARFHVAKDGKPAIGNTSLVDGRILVSLDTSRFEKPNAALGDVTSKDTVLRALAHETTHALDHKYGLKNGENISDDPTFKEGGAVWAEMRAAQQADPTLDVWFGYFQTESFKGQPHRELFAQLGALRARYPEKLNEHFREGRQILDDTIEAVQALDSSRLRRPAERRTGTGKSVPRATEGADSQGGGGPEAGGTGHSGRSSLTAAVSQALGTQLTPAQAKNATATAAAVAAGGGAVPPPASSGTPQATPPNGPQTLASMMKFVRDVLKPQERQIIDRVVSRGAVTRKLREIYAGNDTYLRMLDHAKLGLEARIALAYFAWRDGKFNVGTSGASVLETIGDELRTVAGVAGDTAYAQRIFADTMSGYIEQRRKTQQSYSVKERVQIANKSLQTALDFFNDTVEKIERPISAVFQASRERIKSWGIPSANRILAALHRGQGTVDNDRGMHYEITHETAKFMRRADKAMRDLTAADQKEVLRALQSQGRFTLTGPKRAAYNTLRGMMDDLHAYMNDAGVKVDKVKNYWPVQMNIRDDTSKAALKALLMQPKFEAAIRRKMGDDPNHPAPINTLVDGMVQAAATGDDSVLTPTSVGAPAFKPLDHRFMDFIYKLGDDTDVKTFTELQVDDPYESYARYVEPAMRRAAYARRFGDDGSKLTTLLDRMKKEGATPAQVKEVSGLVEAAVGAYGHDGSPVLKAISPALAERVKGRKTQEVMQALQAYQNVRVLPLAVVGSLIDPLGVAVRTGGDMKAAWRGMKAGLRSIFDSSTRAELLATLELLGATDETSTLAAGYGGGMTPTSRKINDFVFKWNGLAGWTRATRFMAIEAGHAFLLKHAKGTSPQSKRYLDELGLKPDDIQPQTVYRSGVPVRESVRLTSGNKARDQRVQRALSQFVDEAILRPNATQRPLWHNDPYMGLVTQYKSFGYAIWDQIGGRIGREDRHGNGMVFLPALLYLPAALMAELLRELIQHGPDGNPYREKWGADDYAMLAFERSGWVFSPTVRAGIDAVGDVSRNKLPGTSQIGPTASQAGHVYDAFSGRRNLGRTFEESLPASSLWKRWNDDPEGFVDNTPIGATIQLFTGEAA